MFRLFIKSYDTSFINFIMHMLYASCINQTLHTGLVIFYLFVYHVEIEYCQLSIFRWHELQFSNLVTSN